jgi:hypothetical protein
MDLWVVNELGLKGPRHKTNSCHSPSLDGVNNGSVKDSSTTKNLLTGSNDVRTLREGIRKLLNGRRHTNVNRK